MSRGGGAEGRGAGRGRPPAVLVLDPGGRARPLHAPIRSAVRRVLGSYGADLEVEVLLAGDREMRRLNRRFHGVDATTDVLSFPLADGNGGPGGAVALSVPRARAEARRRRKSWRGEVLLYVLHGVLHLLGHRDGTEPARRRMRAAERAQLRSLGFRGSDLH